MSQESLEKFGAYRLAMELFDLVVEDMGQVKHHTETYRLIGQQVASADSICANIEEGHGRGTTKDYTHFLVIARGSTRETRGRYVRMKHWLPADVISDRIQKCDAILGILSKSIVALRRRSSASETKPEERTSIAVPQAKPRPVSAYPLSQNTTPAFTPTPHAPRPSSH